MTENLSKLIDHALLNPSLTDEELEKGCLLALEWNVASVCIKPYFLKRCSEILKGSSVLPSTTIGFPHGGHTVSLKMAEAFQAYEDGCMEYDVVVNIGKVLSGDWEYVRNELQVLTSFVHMKKGWIKVIFENALISDEQKIRLCEICADLKVDYAKTSTGFAPTGATLEDVRLMLQHLPTSVKVKASGGILTLDQLLEFRKLGVARIGTSRTESFLREWNQRMKQAVPGARD